MGWQADDDEEEEEWNNWVICRFVQEDDRES